MRSLPNKLAPLVGIVALAAGACAAPAATPVPPTVTRPVATVAPTTPARAALGEVTIVSPKDGDRITTTDITVSVNVTGADTACKWLGLPDRPGQSHLHVMLGGMGMARLVNIVCGMNSFTVSGEGVKPGPQTLIVDLATNTHMDLERTAKQIKFDYQPTTVKPLPEPVPPAGPVAAHIRNLTDGQTVGPTFSVDLGVDNLKPSCDLEGKGNVAGFGHFHVFVDRPTTPAGEVGMISMPCGPMMVDLGAWPSGKHTLTVEIAQNDHTPLTGAKEASVTINLNNPAMPTQTPGAAPVAPGVAQTPVAPAAPAMTPTPVAPRAVQTPVAPTGVQTPAPTGASPVPVRTPAAVQTPATMQTPTTMQTPAAAGGSPTPARTSVPSTVVPGAMQTPTTGPGTVPTRTP